eukprot:gnl/MRDRNA2_/MRDRNA2_142396_c0_seq1.p1 gnl/MRDRNA2_/MRDRNA2_142396_c0~~gnl/MRDRNA2_/MRDRNA2_142396_c0_seq1.p1  ORF type:complete len:266 (+),score=27.55 gnl/MRDRNA2_/MRDRNA2_142396_c0_seq1:98-895(+)
MVIHPKRDHRPTQNGSASLDTDVHEVSSEKSFDMASDAPRLEPNSKTQGGIVVPHIARAPDGRTVIVRPSTAVFPNRVRDKIRIEAQLRLPETGDPRTEFYSRSGNLLFAIGYDRIVYGDHGPYIEFGEKHVRWHAFPIFRLKPDWSFFDEWYTIDGTLMLYAQKRLVTDKPNPPSGQWAVNNNRPEGYADYRIGKYYVPCEVDEITAILRLNSQPSPGKANFRLNHSFASRGFNDKDVEKASPKPTRKRGTTACSPSQAVYSKL